MADLITSARAKYALGGTQGNANLTLHADEEDTLEALITAVTKAITRYTHRVFDSQTYDELYDAGEDHILLRRYPIISVAWVRYNLSSVLAVQNTNTSTNQRATVAVTSAGITLVRVASGVTTTDTSVTFAGNVTLAAVAAAINALGAGWSAEAESDYALWPSADLYCSNDAGEQQGALDCRGEGADLMMHVAEFADFAWHARRGILRLHGAADWLPDSIRVKYTAGYATVPEDIQEACASWVASLFWETKKNPHIGNSFSSSAGAGYLILENNMPPHVKRILDTYRQHRI